MIKKKDVLHYGLFLLALAIFSLILLVFILTVILFEFYLIVWIGLRFFPDTSVENIFKVARFIVDATFMISILLFPIWMLSKPKSEQTAHVPQPKKDHGK